MRTDGSRSLLRWMRRTGTRQATLAARIGVGQATVSRWASGAIRPEGAHRTALRSIAGIEEDAWLTAAERRRLERLASTGTEG